MTHAVNREKARLFILENLPSDHKPNYVITTTLKRSQATLCDQSLTQNHIKKVVSQSIDQRDNLF